MTDHTKRQYDLAIKDEMGYGNAYAVALVMIALVVPNLITLMIG